MNLVYKLPWLALYWHHFYGFDHGLIILTKMLDVSTKAGYTLKSVIYWYPIILNSLYL